MKSEESESKSYDGREQGPTGGSRASKRWSTRAQEGKQGPRVTTSGKDPSVQVKKGTLMLEDMTVFLLFSVFSFFLYF